MTDARGSATPRPPAAAPVSPEPKSATNLPASDQDSSLSGKEHSETEPRVQGTVSSETKAAMPMGSSGGIASGWAQDRAPGESRSGAPAASNSDEQGTVVVSAAKGRATGAASVRSSPPAPTSSIPAGVAPVSAPRPISSPGLSSSQPPAQVPRAASAPPAAAPVSAPGVASIPSRYSTAPSSAGPAAVAPPSAPPFQQNSFDVGSQVPRAPQPSSVAPASFTHADLYGVQQQQPAPAQPVTSSPDEGKKGKKKRKKNKDSEVPASDPGLQPAGTFENRLDATSGVALERRQAFTVENGTVIPRSGQKTGKKKNSLMSTAGLAGGRWQQYLFRVVVLFALGIVILAGLFSMFSSGAAEKPPVIPGSNFPTLAAQNYAARFVQIYYTWEQGDNEARTQALRDFFPSIVDTDTERSGPVNGATAQSVVNVIPGKVKLNDDQHANLEFAMLIDPGNRYQYQCVELPVFANKKDGSVAVMGMPSLKPCEVTSGVKVPEFGQGLEADDQSQPQIEEDLQKFFIAYGLNDLDGLRTWSSKTSNVIRGLNTPMVFKAYERSEVYLDKAKNKRQVYVRITWEYANGGGQINSDYVVIVRRNADTGGWIVDELRYGIPNGDFAPPKGGVPQPAEDAESETSSDTGTTDPASSPSDQPAVQGQTDG